MKGFAGIAAAIVAVGAAVLAGGLALASAPSRRGVVAGVILACGVQLLVFAVARVALQGQMAQYAVGLMARLALVVVSALVVGPAGGLPMTPFLLSMVTVLFATTLLEPVVVAAGTRNKS